MEAPMSEWFQSIPIALDSIANATKFQHETMAAQIRFHRARHQQQKALIERLKHDFGELKKLNEQLQHENNRLRQHAGKNQFPVAGFHPNQPEAFINVNGKRPHTGALSYDETGARASTSSPRSVTTPLGPNRLTLPHGQTPPNLTSNGVSIENSSSANDSQLVSTPLSQHRPTSAFINKYAYVPPATPQFHRPQLTHAQITPRTFKKTKPNPEPRQAQPQQHSTQTQVARSMPPPPTPARFRTARASQTSAQPIRYDQTQDLPPGSSDRQWREMTEISSQTRSHQSGLQAGQANHGTISHTSSGTKRFYPQTQQSAPSTDQTSTAPMSNGPQRFFPAGARAPSRAQQADHGGQRPPFIPRDQLGYIV
ncbi:hypothetical protein E4T56_gene7089 [Termitomyces sp. T112]|nr:hypothetical protein E4T56_gene7089 [Termitomyces sp. T112]